MRIDLGCGQDKHAGHIGVDRLPLVGVDVVTNFEEALPFRTDSIDSVYSKSALEHVERFELLMSELHRVVRRGGTIRILVPHFSSPLSFSDYTHKRFFGYYTFDYFVPTKQQKSRRKVPDFYTTFKFKIISKRLKFVTYFLPLLPAYWLWERLVNANETFALFYESMLCYVIPCYSMEIHLEPVKPGE